MEKHIQQALVNKKPCNECPFRKQSAPGYLGEASWKPEIFLRSLEHDPLPCHLAVDWEDDDGNPDDIRYEVPCIGALQYLKNIAKLPRNLEYAKLRNEVECSDEIFQNRQQFINHHSKQNVIDNELVW